MFPTFISILDIQSWWEVPSIAHFCSLFRTAFNLLDFDIEDLEEALLNDGTEETSWLPELIVRLLSGCLPKNEISTFNYQMFLRRLFRRKCEEHDCYNPFNTDIDFQLLPLRTKVDILHSLCEFRLDANDVFDKLKNLEADSLRVEPLGYDSNESAYWYFYGTRLYREDFNAKNSKKKSVWQVICFTEADWFQLTKKFKKSSAKVEKQLHHTLSENFLPELPRLFKKKEKLARKRLLENQPRRTSSRLRKLDEDQVEALDEDSLSEGQSRDEMAGAKSKDKKAKTRQRKLSEASSSSKDALASDKSTKRNKKNEKRKDGGKGSAKPTTTVGRQTNNSLAAATGQIVIQSLVAAPNKKKLKTSQVFRQTEEDLQTGMHKILDYVKNHEDAWPFADPVEEEYAPNYYTIIRKPMDLQRMEERLDSGYYKSYSKFKGDFQLIVDNCRLYNGAENEYTEMVDNLTHVFERATEKYLDQISSSDDEIAVEYSDKNKLNKKKKLQEPIKPVSNRRKPMLAAQTDKKRERSLSEESLHSIRSTSFDSLKSKPQPVTKKTIPPTKEKEKKEKIKPKLKTNKPPKRKEKEKSPIRSRSSSVSSEPPPSDCSSPPRSGPTSPIPTKKRKSTEIVDVPIKKTSWSPLPKDKHNKLRETIEKLKAKSAKPAPSAFDFNVETDPPKENKVQKDDKNKPKMRFKPKRLEEDTNSASSLESKKRKAPPKNNNLKNVAAIDALTLATEQTLKDINKWLDDTPKYTEFSSASNSPSYNLDELDLKKIVPTKKELPFMKTIKKPPLQVKPFKRREVQRTIDRLQPGKSKGNLITNVSNNKSDESFPLTRIKDAKNSLIVKTDTNAPKLSLGTVLDSFGKHKFVDDFKKEDCKPEKSDLEPDAKETKVEEPDSKTEEKPTDATKKEDDTTSSTTTTETKTPKEPAAEDGATPNLSAWFKAFGAPKATPKKAELKPDGKENEKLDENKPPIEIKKVIPIPDPSPSLDQPAPRTRKISTGSSMSERSSLDSPRVGIDERLGVYPAPYPSPLHRGSPVQASPRPDVSPKAYPAFNGQIRVGFYQDTVSNKSSPDKSPAHAQYSADKSPAHAQYSAAEHVYTPNTTATNYSYANSSPFYSTPNYSSTNPTPPYNTDVATGAYYDTNKSLTEQYQAKNYSPGSNLPVDGVTYQQESKKLGDKVQAQMFPVKKRAYNEVGLEQQQQVDVQAKYVHQNIPEPKVGGSQLEFAGKPVELDGNNGLRNVNYPTPPGSNPYQGGYDGNYPLNIPTRGLPVPQTSVTDLDRKIDMSKYTNMGYNGPEVNYPRSLPSQYNRPDVSYTRTAAPPPQVSVNSANPPPPNDMSIRYGNPNVTLQMGGYKSMEMSANHTNVAPQAHSNFPPSSTHSNHQVENVASRLQPPASQDLTTLTPASGYKPPEVSIPRPTYNTPPIDVDQPLGLRGNMANLSHIVDRCYANPNDERMLSGLPTSSSSGYYGDKLGGAHMFNKPPAMFSQANMAMGGYNQNMQGGSSGMYNRQMVELQNMQVGGAGDGKVPAQLEKKSKKRKSKAAPNPVEPQQPNPQGFQSYAGLKTNPTIEPSAISLKTSSVVPGSAFNFGPTPSGIGLYGDKDAYPNFLDDFRSAPNYYMAAAAAAHHRAAPQPQEQPEKQPNQQQSAGYSFLGAPQARPTYPIGGPFIPPAQAQLMDANSPIYQHYLQAGVQSLLGPPAAYPPGYHPALSMRQPYDSMTRPSWL